MQIYKHWRKEVDAEQILMLYLDKQNASVNTLDQEVMREFGAIVREVATQQAKYKGVILQSAKTSGFIAGADIKVFTQFKDIAEATALLREGQQILDQLEALSIPVIALIDGFCLGGGLEIALACHYRIVEEGTKTRLGLPEVKLGIHPGWGGTVRLPRLIGSWSALQLILSGQTLSAQAARKIGLVDEVVPRRQLISAARSYVHTRPKRKRPQRWQTVVDYAPARPVVVALMRREVAKKINPLHYPAPMQILDNWDRISIHEAAAYEREATTCGRLFFSETAQNLVRVFLLQERLKGFARNVPHQVTHVHVIGAGTMGGDIAAWCAVRGLRVTLQDLEPKFLAPAFKRAHSLFKYKLKQPHLVQKAIDNLIPDVQGDGMQRAQVIIEAVPEQLALKQATMQQIERRAQSDCIIATNTSSIPLAQISQGMQNPDRLLGLHFFNPVARMPLVEIVSTAETNHHSLQRAFGFIRALDRLPLPVKSSPGFLVNRILMPYLLLAVDILNEGIPAAVIDRAMVEFGMPMGPILLADTVGLDVCLSVATYLGEYFNRPVPAQLRNLVAQSKFGVKTGAGFYTYDKQGKPMMARLKETELAQYNRDDIAKRLVLTMLNEAFACLREGVVADSDLLDAGMIFGTGFAPFRGGLIQYAKENGISQLYQEFLQQHPDQALQQQWELTEA